MIDAYPGCPDAVRWGESDAVGPPLNVWDVARCKGYSPAKTLQLMKSGADFALETFYSLGDAEGWRATKLVRDQMDHPNFLRYVAAKLGAL